MGGRFSCYLDLFAGGTGECGGGCAEEGSAVTVEGMRNFPLPFICPVAGVSFRQEVVCAAKPGDPVSVVAVDDNPHDANAVEIRTGRGELAGFVPSALAQRLRATGARRWRGEIVEVLQGQTWGLRVRVLRVDQETAAPLPTPPAVTGEHAVAPPEGEAGVRARSGRFLGMLAGIEDGVVLVRRADGSVCRYPFEIVEVGAGRIRA